MLWGAGGDGTAQMVLRQARQRLRDALQVRLNEGQRLGEVASNADLSALSATIMTFLNGISIERADGATKKELDAAIDMLLACWPGRQ